MMIHGPGIGVARGFRMDPSVTKQKLKPGTIKRIARYEGVVIAVALTVAGVTIFDALLGVINRYFSSRIGEGLIYDLRTQVFDHVQRQPLAFFTRAQTGSLVSRLDGDVV